MAYITTSVEYGIHCLLWLVGDNQRALSSRELAELQGISPAFWPRFSPSWKRRGSSSPAKGCAAATGWRARRMRSVFWRSSTPSKGTSRCSIAEVRGRCAVFDDSPPDWAVSGKCAIHAVMLQAEKAMRDALAAQTLGAVAARFGRKAPQGFFGEVNLWLDERMTERTARSGKTARAKT